MIGRARGTDILLGVIALGGAVALPSSLAWLERARYSHASIAAVGGAPMPALQPVLAPGDAFHGDVAASQRALAAVLRECAAREGAMIETLEPRSAPIADIAFDHFAVSGSQTAVLRTIEAIETRAPAIRMARYRLMATASGTSLRLDGEVAMPVARP